MNAVETIAAQLRKFASNKGNRRLYLILSLLWMLFFLPILWPPYPQAERVGVSFFETARQCEAVILDRESCVLRADRNVAIIAFLWRAGFVLLPALAPAAVAASLGTVTWVMRGYKDGRR